MRKSIFLLAAGAALTATPALAQLGGNAGAGAGVATGPAGDVVQDATQQAGEAVDQADTMASEAKDKAELKLATREQVRAGANVSDADGNSIGTVQSIDGDNAVVVSDGKLYNVPLSELWVKGGDAAGGLVTKLPKSSLEARGDAGAEADTEAR